MSTPTNLYFSLLSHCSYMAMIRYTVSGMLVYTTSSTVVPWAVIMWVFVVSFLSSMTCNEDPRRMRSLICTAQYGNRDEMHLPGRSRGSRNQALMTHKY